MRKLTGYTEGEQRELTAAKASNNSVIDVFSDITDHSKYKYPYLNQHYMANKMSNSGNASLANQQFSQDVMDYLSNRAEFEAHKYILYDYITGQFMYTVANDQNNHDSGIAWGWDENTRPLALTLEEWANTYPNYEDFDLEAIVKEP